MSIKRQCRGCGAYIQSENPNTVGYLPAHLLNEPGKELICQRCYRIKHYGKHEDYSGMSDAEQVIAHGLNWAQGVIVILDIMDFEASIPAQIEQFAAKENVIIALNKVDLLPPKTPVSEAVEWAVKRLSCRRIDGEVIPISSTTGYGIKELLAVLAESDARRWLVAGVTNAGKSTLITKILQKDGKNRGLTPTTARFPGTTVACTRWNLAHGLVLSDSPGLAPKGRLTDLVCLDCAVKLIPSQRLNVGVYRLNTRGALVIPGLAAFRSLEDDALLIGFTASQVKWQRANVQKLDDWLQSRCASCAVAKWQRAEVRIDPQHDLYVHGLGWISIRHKSIVGELTIPHGVEFTVRPNLIGGKME